MTLTALIQLLAAQARLEARQRALGIPVPRQQPRRRRAQYGGGA